MERDGRFVEPASRETVPNAGRPIALGDAGDVIDRWAKLYRFGRAALN
jgi:hypothetical protein